jgi:hypothetical protein
LRGLLREMDAVLVEGSAAIVIVAPIKAVKNAP